MAKQRFSAAQVAQTLRDTKGMVSRAALRLGCDYTTVQRYINRYPLCRDAQREAREQLGDDAELTLARQALGKIDSITGKYIEFPNITALIFLLKTQFKQRGYTERLEIDVRYVQIIKQIESLSAKQGIEASDLFNDLIAELSRAGSPAGEGTD